MLLATADGSEGCFNGEQIETDLTTFYGLGFNPRM